MSSESRDVCVQRPEITHGIIVSRESHESHESHEIVLNLWRDLREKRIFSSNSSLTTHLSSLPIEGANLAVEEALNVLLCQSEGSTDICATEAF